MVSFSGFSPFHPVQAVRRVLHTQDGDGSDGHNKPEIDPRLIPRPELTEHDFRKEPAAGPNPFAYNPHDIGKDSWTPRPKGPQLPN